ncbi:MAG: ASCH domain-containing protein [Anaerolineae bacterium]|nr:ASCH domain-containing protein [Anaerolineae bacterium]
MNSERIEQYWQAYLATLPADSPIREEKYTAEKFGDGPAMADELGALIVQGIKTATCSALWEWQAEGEDPPQAGLKTIVLDGAGLPLCIIETSQVTVQAYDQVDAQFAHDEGEGDRSLAHWRRVHWDFFGRALAQIGKQPREDMPLVCERFRVIYK